MSTCRLVDAHCHLDLLEAPADHLGLIERAEIYTLAVTTLPSAFPRLQRLLANSIYVRPALGLHPELVATHAHELPLFQESLKHTRYVGEVGLDYMSPSASDRATQRAVLEKIAAWCDARGDTLVSLHSRRAAEDVIATFTSFRGAWILHWFSGSEKALDRALQHGAYFSINRAMLMSERGRRLVARMPRDRVITETDSPFTKAESRESSSPLNVDECVGPLASLWSVSYDEVRAQIFATFASLLRRPRAGGSASAP